MIQYIQSILWNNLAKSSRCADMHICNFEKNLCEQHSSEHYYRHERLQSKIQQLRNFPIKHLDFCSIWQNNWPGCSYWAIINRTFQMDYKLIKSRPIASFDNWTVQHWFITFDRIYAFENLCHHHSIIELCSFALACPNSVCNERKLCWTVTNEQHSREIATVLTVTVDSKRFELERAEQSHLISCRLPHLSIQTECIVGVDLFRLQARANTFVRMYRNI